MKVKNNLDLVSNLLEKLSPSKEEQDELYIFISKNVDHFFKTSERMVSEVKNIKDRHPNDWREMVAMTMFSTI